MRSTVASVCLCACVRRYKLEDSAQQIQHKVEELFKAHQQQRQLQMLNEQLQQRLQLIEKHAVKSDELSRELEQNRREQRDRADVVEQLQRDLERYSRENSSMKKKLASVTQQMLSEKRPQQGAGQGLYASSDAGREVGLLAQTVRQLRQQLGAAQSAAAAVALRRELPPLPRLKRTHIHATSHHSLGENLGAVSARERLAPESKLAGRLSKVAADASRLSAQLADVRAAPRLVDLSQAAVSPQLQYQRSRAHTQRMSAEAERLQHKLATYLSRSAADGASSKPQLAAAPEKGVSVGRVVIPVAAAGTRCLQAQLGLDRAQLAQVFAVFV